jgi:hypothetical protein
LKKQEEKWISEMATLKQEYKEKLEERENSHSAEQARMRADGLKAR